MHHRRSRRPLAALALLLGLSGAAAASESACDGPVADLLPVIDRMQRAWSRVSDYTARLEKTERFVDGSLTRENGIVRFRKPNQIYLEVVEGPNAGAVVLFPKPGTDDVILGRPGGISGAVAGLLVKLPAVGGIIPHEFSLDDPRLLDGQHHPLPDSSIGGMIRLIAANVRTAARRNEGSACVRGAEPVDGRRSTRIEVRLPAREGQWHAAVEGETVWHIGEDYAQDRYVIVYNNASVKRWNHLPAGTRIFIPRYYAPRAMIWVSEQTDLPLRLRMYDDRGRLYEAYSNLDLRIDVGLSDRDFDPVRHGFPAPGTRESELPASPAGIR